MTTVDSGIAVYAPRLQVPTFEFPPSDYGAVAYTALAAVSGANDGYAAILAAPATGDITAVSFATSTVTTGATLDVRVETVNATTGDPSGTLWATNTNGAHALANTDDNVIKSQTLTAAATVTQGDMLAVVVKNPAASPGNFQIRGCVGGNSKMRPYGDRYVTSVWTKNATTPMVALSYNGTYYQQQGSPCFGGNGSTLEAFNNTTSVREFGLQFVAPGSWRVRGAWAAITNGSDVNFDVILYEDTTAVLTLSCDGNIRRANGVHYFQFASTYRLRAGKTYRIVVKPTTSTSISCEYMISGSNAMLATYHGVTNAVLARKSSAGAWSTDTSSVGLVGLICDAVGL